MVGNNMGKDYYLATTAISEIWDFKKQIILLGPWCLTGAEKTTINHLLLPSPWQPRIKIKEAADHCYRIYQEMLPDIALALNKIHGLSKPEIYWKILLGPWLMHFIGIVYDRQNSLENAMQLFPNLVSSALPNRQCELWAYDTYDFMAIRGQATTDYYNLGLFSLILKYLYPERVFKADLVVPPVKRISCSTWRSNLIYYLNETRNVFSRGSVVLSDMYNVSYLQNLYLEMGSTIINRKFKPAIKAKEKRYSESARAGFSFGDTKDRFKSLLHTLIPKAIPACYIENYADYAKGVKSTPPVKIVGSAVGWYFNESFKFFAAEAAANGAQMVEFQHGGGYGITLSFPTELSAMEKDKFYTWGWVKEGGNTIPLASPYLSKLHNSYIKKSEDILFISNLPHKYFNRFFTHLTPHDVPTYFKNKSIFFQSLRAEARTLLSYRPYQEVGWKEVENIRELMPDIRFLTHARLTGWMKKAGLVVIDHQSTAILEALVINIPSIFFWDFSIELIRPEAKSYFDMLKDAGILYGTPEEAAAKVNEIYSEPLSWWRNAKIQRARDEFCRNFALTSVNWRKEWIKALDACG